MPNTTVKKGAIIKYAIVGEDTTVGENAKIGDECAGSDKKIAVVGMNRDVENGNVIKPDEVY